MDPLLIDLDQAARTLCVGRNSIYKLIDSGDIKRVKVGRRALITTASLHAYVAREAGEHEARDSAPAQ